MWNISKSELGSTSYYRDGGLFIISKFKKELRSFVYIDRQYKEKVTDNNLEVLKLKSLLCLKENGFKITKEDFKEIIK